MASAIVFYIILFVLQPFRILRAQCAVLNSSPPLITPAPAQHLQLQEHLQERAAYVTCSQWTIPGVGQPICDIGRTCMFQVRGYYEGCYNPSITTSIDFGTACYNYPTTFANAGVSTYLCPASAPYCGQYIFVNTNGGTYTNLGCSTTPYFFRATQTLAFDAGPTTSLSSVNPINNPATPVTVISPTTIVQTGTTIVQTQTLTPTDSITSSEPITSFTEQTVTITTGGSVVIFPFTRSSSTSTTTSTSGPIGGSGSNAAVIGGAVGGAVSGIALVIGAILLFCCLKRRNKHPRVDPGKEPGIQSPEPSTYSPPYSPPMGGQRFSEGQQYAPGYGQPMGMGGQQYAQPMGGPQYNQPMDGPQYNQPMGGQQYAQGTRSPPPMREQTYSPPLGTQHC